MRKTKKSQAALEFLTTYGWAFLVILIMISALAYFGILNPSNLLSNKCNIESEFGCKDFTIASNGIKLRLSNNVGEAIIVDSVSASTEIDLNCASNIIGNIWKSGDSKDTTINCDFTNSALVAGQKGKINLEITYHLVRSGSAYARHVKGEVFSAVQNIAVPPLLNIVGYWHFDENNGMTAADSSGNGNTGTLTPILGPLWTTGKYGSALQFDGVDDGVSAGDGVSLQFTPSSKFSFGAWIKTSDTSWFRIINKKGGPNDRGWDCVGQPTFVRFHLIDTWGIISRARDATGLNINDNNWHHIMCTYDGSGSITGMKIYIDGIEASAYSTYNDVGTLSNINSGQPLYIGKQWNDAPNEHMNGVIDEVKIYNKALTDAEVLGDYNS